MSYFTNEKKQHEIGILCAIMCFFIWGVLPIYWKALQPINSVLIMLYRLLLTSIFIFIVDIIIFKWEGIKEPLKRKGAIQVFLLAGLLISFNWGLFIWAVNAGHIIQTSIGYYIEPLMICAFGVLFFREKLDKYKLCSIVAACIGVIVMLFSYGQLPMLALLIALTFALYTTIKKKLQAPALLSLLYETVFLAPAALGIIVYMEINEMGAIANSQLGQLILLSFAGVFTTVPLVLFAMAANRITMIALGVIGYISPSITLLLGVFIYKEAFDLYQFTGLVMIWIGLIVFTIGGIRTYKNSRESLDETGISEPKDREPDKL